MMLKKLNNFKINVRIEKVLAYLKFRKNTEIDKNIEILIFEEIQEFYDQIETLAVYKIDDKKDFLFENSNDVKNLLKNSEKIVVFAATIGKKFDDKIKTFGITKAAIWDAIGSEAVEQCANYVNEYVRKKVLLDDYLTTKRYSAGYGDWEVKSNILIIKYLELNEITVTEYGLLRPEKTITAIFGLERRGV